MNTTIDRYATVTLQSVESSNITIKSIDYDTTVQYSIDKKFVYDGQLDLAKGVLNWVKAYAFGGFNYMDFSTHGP